MSLAVHAYRPPSLIDRLSTTVLSPAVFLAILSAWRKSQPEKTNPRNTTAPSCCAGSSSRVGICATRSVSRGRLPATRQWSIICRSKRAAGRRAPPSSCAGFELDECLLRRLHMEILIAFELIFGVIFIVVFWCTNLELQLARGSRQLQWDPYDDEWNDDSGVNRRRSAMRVRVHG